MQPSLVRQVFEEARDSGGERRRMVTPSGRVEARKGHAEHLLDLASEILGQRRAGAAVGAQAGPLGHPVGDESVDVDRQVRNALRPVLGSELTEGDQHRDSGVNAGRRIVVLGQPFHVLLDRRGDP